MKGGRNGEIIIIKRIFGKVFSKGVIVVGKVLGSEEWVYLG